ncbi:MAG: hypothetical protein CMJ18_05525 [Phycisphaeraceae bacterium]|nr:hypothetical protein [Phycisphaeraceae bacterium]
MSNDAPPASSAPVQDGEVEKSIGAVARVAMDCNKRCERLERRIAQLEGTRLNVWVAATLLAVLTAFCCGVIWYVGQAA